MTEATQMRITGVTTTAVPVTDHDRAIDFYTRRLGLEVRMDAAFGPGMRWVEVGTGVGSTIALAPIREGKSAGVDTGIRLGTSDAAADHLDLEAHGVDCDGILNFPGVPPMFSFRDPDGNTLYIVQTS